MSPALFISLPIVLLILMAKGAGTQNTKVLATPSSIEKMKDDFLATNPLYQGDEIIIIRKQATKNS